MEWTGAGELWARDEVGRTIVRREEPSDGISSNFM